ncbi:hypothetical protein [Sphingobium sp.]|uniref:hypothetical protein n=1 Tax=Sphingobium sp. TaxID=1912891 RepID=UPI00261A6EFB|nr:hypothetical protein [Sphingobium sp.]
MAWLGWRMMMAMLAGAASIPAMAQERAEDAPIIVEGRRDTPLLARGQWRVAISRSYHFGRPLDWDEMRPQGTEKEWRFCLPDSDVAAFARLLVGEGQSEAAGGTRCGPLTISMGDGRLRATQSCTGGHMVTGKPKTSKPARQSVTVTGDYGADRILLHFEGRQEPMIPDPGYQVQPDMRRWTILGERMGECPVGSE